MAKATITSGAVFQRHEKKYLLAPRQYGALRELLAPHLQPDEYGRHTICTLYYDTEDFAVIRRCLEKPQFREKLRLRSYGVPGPGSTVYLELKKKLAGVTYKRRVPMHLQEAGDYMEAGWPPAGQGQIFGEIDWYVRQRPLSGKVVLCYDRVALTGREDPALRITFDGNLRWRDTSLALEKGAHGTPLLPAGTRLMEVKTLGALPCWLAQLLSQVRAYPTSYSKYGTVYSRFLAGKELMRHVG